MSKPALLERRDAVLAAWLERALEPQFLREPHDPFRNPTGQAFREALPVLLDEILRNMDEARIEPALEQIVRIRAVQNLEPSQAVAFLFALKDLVLGEEAARRIDRLALAAFDLYMRCREQVWRIQAGEARRRVFVMERAALRENRP